MPAPMDNAICMASRYEKPYLFSPLDRFGRLVPRPKERSTWLALSSPASGDKRPLSEASVSGTSGSDDHNNAYLDSLWQFGPCIHDGVQVKIILGGGRYYVFAGSAQAPGRAGNVRVGTWRQLLMGSP